MNTNCGWRLGTTEPEQQMGASWYLTGNKHGQAGSGGAREQLTDLKGLKRGLRESRKEDATVGKTWAGMGPRSSSMTASTSLGKELTVGSRPIALGVWIRAVPLHEWPLALPELPLPKVQVSPRSSLCSPCCSAEPEEKERADFHPAQVLLLCSWLCKKASCEIQVLPRSPLSFSSCSVLLCSHPHHRGLECAGRQESSMTARWGKWLASSGDCCTWTLWGALAPWKMLGKTHYTGDGAGAWVVEKQ